MKEEDEEEKKKEEEEEEGMPRVLFMACEKEQLANARERRGEGTGMMLPPFFFFSLSRSFFIIPRGFVEN